MQLSGLVKIKKISSDNVTVTFPAAIIDDVIMVLEKLVSFAGHIKSQNKYAAAQRNATDPATRAKRDREFHTKCLKVYRRYKQIEKAEISTSEAFRVLAKEHGFTCFDGRLYVSTGRKLVKKQRQADIITDYNNKVPLKDIADRYKLSVCRVRVLLKDELNAEIPSEKSEGFCGGENPAISF